MVSFTLSRNNVARNMVMFSYMSRDDDASLLIGRSDCMCKIRRKLGMRSNLVEWGLHVVKYSDI